MAVTNLHERQDDHATVMAEFAICACQAASDTLIDEEDQSMGSVQIRVGFHSGPCVTSVIGTRTPRYSVIGDTVNVAARMESLSLPGRILCSHTSGNLILEGRATNAEVECRGLLDVKGKGDMLTCWVGDSTQHM